MVALQVVFMTTFYATSYDKIGIMYVLFMRNLDLAVISLCRNFVMHSKYQFYDNIIIQFDINFQPNIISVMDKIIDWIQRKIISYRISLINLPI